MEEPPAAPCATPGLDWGQTAAPRARLTPKLLPWLDEKREEKKKRTKAVSGWVSLKCLPGERQSSPSSSPPAVAPAAALHCLPSGQPSLSSDGHLRYHVEGQTTDSEPWSWLLARWPSLEIPCGLSAVLGI